MERVSTVFCACVRVTIGESIADRFLVEPICREEIASLLSVSWASQIAMIFSIYFPRHDRRNIGRRSLGLLPSGL